METNQRHRANAARPAQGSLRRSAHGIFAGLTFAVLAALPSAAGADPSREAVAVRHLQSQMMVAALSCEMRGPYNTVVERFERELVGHGKSLREYFRQAHGDRAQRELDRFITALANQASGDMIAAGPGFCTRAGTMFEEVLALPVSSLGVYSVRRFDPDGQSLPRVESAAAR